MSKKPLGKDKFGVQKVMRVKDYFGDATGQFALNAMSTLVGQLTYFYTDKVGMAAGAVSYTHLGVSVWLRIKLYRVLYQAGEYSI